jgi:hypothetical protein
VNDGRWLLRATQQGENVQCQTDKAVKLQQSIIAAL